MPSKYTVRSYTKNSYYHIYNRGIGDQQIFLDEEDYTTYYYYLFVYLASLERSARRFKDIPMRLAHKNLSSDITLISYCLMPDHFHLVLHQKSEDGVTKLMKQLTNAYTQYFNQKYKRVGSLFAGRYKAAHIPTTDTLIHLTRHIHLHPVLAKLSLTPEYAWSSYSEFADPTPRNLASTKTILNIFPSIYMYKKFVSDQKDYTKRMDKIASTKID